MYGGVIGPITDPDSGLPTDMTEYRQGTAAIEITGADGTQTVTLDEVSSGSSFDGHGAMATWRNDEGWSVELFAYGAAGGPGMSEGDITMRWIHDSDIWTAGSYTSMSSPCTVQLSEL